MKADQRATNIARKKLTNLGSQGVKGGIITGTDHRNEAQASPMQLQELLQ